MSEPITNCHQVEAIIISGDEGTNHYECPICHESVNSDGYNPNLSEPRDLILCDCDGFWHVDIPDPDSPGHNMTKYVDMADLVSKIEALMVDVPISGSLDTKGKGFNAAIDSVISIINKEGE